MIERKSGERGEVGRGSELGVSGDRRDDMENIWTFVVARDVPGCCG